MTCHILILVAVFAAGAASVTSSEGHPPTILEQPSDVFAVAGRVVVLFCRHAKNANTAEVSWYKDGTKVVTQHDNPLSYSTLLEIGDLVILQFQPSDAGRYYCNVTNSFGIALSNSVTVEMAYMKEEFRSSPKDVTIVEGQAAVFYCLSPLAVPKARITFEIRTVGAKMAPVTVGGVGGNIRSRIESDERATLIIANVTSANAGEYLCIAENKAGRKLSAPARLTVLERPVITTPPEDMTVNEGKQAVLRCVAHSRGSGSEPVSVSWLVGSSEIEMLSFNGQVSSFEGHWFVTSDGSLMTRKAAADDEGTYTCLAAMSGSSSGSAVDRQATAYLMVNTAPRVLGRPIDRMAVLGGSVFFHCQADGSPPPMVIWQTPRSIEQQHMYARGTYGKGKYTVSSNGTLLIINVTHEDEGEYTCRVLNDVSGDFAIAKLRVTVSGLEALPIVTSRPRNIVTAAGLSTVLNCAVDGSRGAAPTVRWLKDGRPLLAGTRFSMEGSVNLKIADVHVTDSGNYTCLVMAESGDISASAVLTVTGLRGYTRQPTDPPPPPGKPHATAVLEAAVALSWPAAPSNLAKGSAEWMYSAEAFSYADTQGWTALAHWSSAPSHGLTFTPLQPGTSYYFVIRARSSSGCISEPSPPSDIIHTGELPTQKSRDSSGLSQTWLNQVVGPALKNTSSVVAIIGTPMILSSTSINVTWAFIATNVMDTPSAGSGSTRSRPVPRSPYVEGFYVRAFARINGVGERRTDTVFSSYSTYHVITNLAPYTVYHISVAPFYAAITGTATPVVTVTTAEDVPTGAPRDVRATRGEGDSFGRLLISWKRPAESQSCGNVLGYNVYLSTAIPGSSHNLTVNSSSLAVYIDLLPSEIVYSVAVAAYTSVGVGATSAPLIVSQLLPSDKPEVNSDKVSLVEEPWFLPTVIGIVGLTVGAVVLILVVCVCLRHRSSKPMCSKRGRFLSVPFHGHHGDSGMPEAYLTYHLEAERLSSPPLQHGHSMASPAVTRHCIGYHGESPPRDNSPVPSYPPPPPSRWVAVEEHNLDSSGDSASAMQFGAGPSYRGGRKGAFYTKSTAVCPRTDAGSSSSSAAGPYATACLYELDKDCPSAPASRSPALPSGEHLNLHGSESSCTDNNGRSSAGGGSEGFGRVDPLGVPHSGIVVDSCSYCTAPMADSGCYSEPHGIQGTSPPRFADILPPPPHYPPYCTSCAEGPMHEDADDLTDWPSSQAPTSMATLLRHVQPPMPAMPLHHQHSAPCMREAAAPGGAFPTESSTLLSPEEQKATYAHCHYCSGAGAGARTLAGPHVRNGGPSRSELVRAGQINGRHCDDRNIYDRYRTGGVLPSQAATPSALPGVGGAGLWCTCPRSESHHLASHARGQSPLGKVAGSSNFVRREQPLADNAQLCRHASCTACCASASGQRNAANFPSSASKAVPEREVARLDDEELGASAAEYEEPWDDQPWLSGLRAAAAAAAGSWPQPQAVAPPNGAMRLVGIPPSCTEHQGDLDCNPDAEVAMAMTGSQPQYDESEDTSSDGGKTNLCGEGKTQRVMQPSKRHLPRGSAARRQPSGSTGRLQPSGASGHSTDGGGAFVPPQRRPYPKSARRQQMQQQQKRLKASDTRVRHGQEAGEDVEVTDRV